MESYEVEVGGKILPGMMTMFAIELAYSDVLQ